MFSGCTVSLDTKENKLRRRNLETSPSRGKNTWKTFNVMPRMEVCPFSYFFLCEFSGDSCV